MNTAQQMIIFSFSPQPPLRLSQPSVRLRSCPRWRNPAWPAVWSAGEKKWSSPAPTSSQSPRSSSWRKALVRVMSAQQLTLEPPLQKQLVPIKCVKKSCFMVVWQILSERPPWIKQDTCHLCGPLDNHILRSHTWGWNQKLCSSAEGYEVFIIVMADTCLRGCEQDMYHYLSLNKSSAVFPQGILSNAEQIYVCQ